MTGKKCDIAEVIAALPGGRRSKEDIDKQIAEERSSWGDGEQQRDVLVISEFDRWVGDHNPPEHLEYGKGWWDYVEVVRRITDKFDATDVRVLGTYVVNTPPPEEELPMPAVAFVVAGVAFAVKWDFGGCRHWPKEWTVSVQRREPYHGSTFGLFDEHEDMRDVAQGFGPDFIFPPYAQSPQRFTCGVEDELDVAMLIRIFSHKV